MADNNIDFPSTVMSGFSGFSVIHCFAIHTYSFIQLETLGTSGVIDKRDMAISRQVNMLTFETDQ